MITSVPYLIDGNNLMHAAPELEPELSRDALCELLAVLVASGQRVRVVFDGAPPSAQTETRIAKTGVHAEYSLGRSADDLILKHIARDSAPRRLTVVSSDREIRKAARRRRCIAVTSEDFARKLVQLSAHHRFSDPSAPSEPREKHFGPTKEQARQWLREFGIEG